MQQHEPLDIVEEYKKEKQRRKNTRLENSRALPTYGYNETSLPVHAIAEDLESIGESVNNFTQQLEGMKVASVEPGYISYTTFPTIEFRNNMRQKPIGPR